MARAKGLDRDRWPTNFQKAAVLPGTTTNNAALLRESTAFVELVNRGTIRGQLAAASIAAQPHMRIVGTTSEAYASWVAEGRPIPCTSMASDGPFMDITKYACIVPVASPLIDDPRAAPFIEHVALRPLRRADDREFLSDNAAVPNESPAGLLYNVAGVGAGSPEGISEGLIEELWGAVRNGEADAPFYITSQRGGAYLASLHEDNSARFPNVGPLGGSIHGVPVITSAAAGNKLILIDAAQLATYDLGLEVDHSEVAAISSTDNPGTPDTVVSGFQCNTTFLRFVRYVSWLLAADDAISFVELPIVTSP